MDTSSRNRRILVVDDSVESVRTLARFVRLLGHEVRTASNGIEAVEAAGEFRPHVVLMDIGLPGLDGNEAAARILDRPWGTGVTLIALTACGEEIDERRFREAGFDHHLAKPVDAPTLAELIGTPLRPPTLGRGLSGDAGHSSAHRDGGGERRIFSSWAARRFPIE